MFSRVQRYQQSQVGAALDFVDVRGQEAVKRAITIACAGNHNILMVGPPRKPLLMSLRKQHSNVTVLS